MTDTLSDLIASKIQQVRESYHRLVLLVAPSGSGKTAILRDVSAKTGTPLVNLNLELSQGMLELTKRQRILQFPRLLDGIVKNAPGDVVLLDNTEIIFDTSLKQDPLRSLQRVSRNKTIFASWNGLIEGDYLVHAVPGHPEYRSYTARELVIVPAYKKET
ncbi:MAG TPA: BREX-3 system P-loop-containing protein BrxF [Thermodesulfobacteriota bacterium]|jgi:hypothetical protein|nr:BREX-3 system P-loop-containing protein BrxF [Thermodesulfobacteriota bacterium]